MKNQTQTEADPPESSSMADPLNHVEMPSRYLGSEVNSVHKNPEETNLHLALAFPDFYEIGTSHFGIQILYHILNQEKEIFAERVYAPGPDMGQILKKQGTPLSSLESVTPLKNFHILGFSLLYELNYTNVLYMLDLAGIPFFAKERKTNFPIVIAGGPATVNPEPVADFFDAILIGEGEIAVLQMAKAFLDAAENGSCSKEDVLKRWQTIEGVYIPGLYTPRPLKINENIHVIIPEPNKTGQRGETGNAGFPARIRKAVVPDLNQARFPDSPVLPFGKPVHDRLRLEIARGCTRGCRFCQAGMIYRPARERSLGTLMGLCESAYASTGYEEISLLSLSSGDYCAIEPLLEALMNRFSQEKIAVSLPSLRAGALTPNLVNQIKRVRKTGFTIAPEAGTKRLRAIINKNISEEEIFASVRTAFDLGWQVVKLYFMIGLPFETEEDREGMVDLVHRLVKLVPKGKKYRLNVSVGTFIPKPHTPFQWAPKMPPDKCLYVIETLKNRMKHPGIQFKWHDPRVSFLEGVFARGDRRLSEVLVLAYEKGCRFDGWSDYFRYDAWMDAFHAAGCDPAAISERPRDPDEPLPWDHIDCGVEKSFLKEEWEKAKNQTATRDCRDGECMGCGVCDFKTISPVIIPENNLPAAKRESLPLFKHTAGTGISGKTEPDTAAWKKIRITYSKTEDARFLGHLEMVNLFHRALRRTGIPLEYSRGFHPLPKIRFSNPLPIGMESLNEFFIINVPGDIEPERISEKLNHELSKSLHSDAGRSGPEDMPQGLFVKDAGIDEENDYTDDGLAEEYRIILKDGSIFNTDTVREFLALDSCPVSFTNKKGRISRIDLVEMLPEIRVVHPGCLEIKIKKTGGKTIRPSLVLSEIFDFSEETIKAARIVKQL